MTYTTLKRASLATLAALTITATLPTASAMAAEAPTSNFVVKSTTDGRIKLGVKAYKKGNFARSASLHEQALRAALSSKRTARLRLRILISVQPMPNLIEWKRLARLARRPLNSVRIIHRHRRIKQLWKSA